MKAQWMTYFQFLLPIIVPLVISKAKGLVSSRPSLHWLIPASAPVLGELANFVQSFVTNSALPAGQAAILGALGVFLREIVNEIRKSLPEGTPGAKQVIAWLALPIIATGLMLGCASSGIGKAVQAADAQKQLVERAAVEFVKLKLKGDPRITPAVYDQGRAAYEKYQVSQAAVADALSSWKVVSSPENESKLQTALTEVTKNINTYLALVGKFVDLDALKKKISRGEGIQIKRYTAINWSDAEYLARAELRLALEVK